MLCVLALSLSFLPPPTLSPPAPLASRQVRLDRVCAGQCKMCIRKLAGRAQFGECGDGFEALSVVVLTCVGLIWSPQQLCQRCLHWLRCRSFPHQFGASASPPFSLPHPHPSKSRRRRRPPPPNVPPPSMSSSGDRGLAMAAVACGDSCEWCFLAPKNMKLQTMIQTTPCALADWHAINIH